MSDARTIMAAIEAELIPYKSRIAELEAENTRLVKNLAAHIFNVDIDEFGEALVQQVREFVNSEKYQRVFGKKQGGDGE